MKFDINQYRGDYAMHCKTLEDATTFTEYLAKNGRAWCSNESYRNNTHYHKHKEETAYNFNEGKMSYVQWYRENGYTVLEFEDFEWDDDITPPSSRDLQRLDNFFAQFAVNKL